MDITEWFGDLNIIRILFGNLETIYSVATLS